jgi:hypothetical protein
MSDTDSPVISAAMWARSREAAAERLDAIVRALAEDAPPELLASANGIVDLSIDGDEIFLAGRRLDALSGAEQLEFAIAIAKRLNAKSRILICDQLERLDPGRLEDFVRIATADGFQLIATRVSSGEMVLEAIEIEDAPAPATARGAA